jgi:hypothetical protein
VNTPVLIPDTHAMPWVAIDTNRDGNVPGPVFKLLTSDPETHGSTVLLHCPPGWRDPVLDWHPTIEEAFTLQGSLQMAWNTMDEGSYLFRPPGVLHGPPHAHDVTGATFVIRMDGESRILRYDGTEFPHAHMQPITDQWQTSPFTWVERLATPGLPWLPVSTGPWAGARVKWLNRRNDGLPGGCAMLQLPPRFQGAGTQCRGQVEELVVDGALEAGGVAFAKWGFACRAAGDAAGSYRSESGATLICWFDADELAA